MRAHAAVVATPAGTNGGCAYETLRSDPPLLLRPTPAGLHLQGGAAGPLGGDQLRLDVHVTTGASLTVRSVAATIVLPGAGPSCLYLSVRVDEGGHLDWQPEPLVSVAASRHRQRAEIELAGGATLRWHECLVLGRTGERPGSITASTRIVRDGTPLFHQDLALGDPGDAAAWRSPAVVADGRVIASEVRVGPTAPDTTIASSDGTDTRGVRVRLADDAVLDQAVGSEVAAVERLMQLA